MSPGDPEMGGRGRIADDSPEKEPGMPDDEQINADMKKVKNVPELSVPVIIFPQEGNIQDHRSQFLTKGEIGSVPTVREFVNRALPVEFPPQVQRSRSVCHGFPDGSDQAEDNASVKDE
jgi:hypothetical protein